MELEAVEPFLQAQGFPAADEEQPEDISEAEPDTTLTSVSILLHGPYTAEHRVKPDLYTNVMSRQADIMVCDGCGWDEAKLAFMHSHGSLYGWTAFQPERPEGDFKDTPGKVWTIPRKADSEKRGLLL